MKELELKKWNESEDTIDSRIATILSEKGWDVLLPDGLDNQDRMKAFYMHIMFVINSFLEEDETRELFIQLPTEELANKDSKGEDAKQTKRFRWLNGTIAACLQMATIEQLRNNLFVSGEVDFDNTKNWYKTGDYFLAKRHDGGYNYVQSILSNDGIRPRLRFIDKPNPRRTFNECIPTSFIRIERIPSQAKNGVKLINKTIELTNKTSGISKNYTSASFVSFHAYSPLNENIITNYSLLNIPFKFFSDYQSAICYNPEIIIVCGDSQYLKVAQAYRNSSAKKIIFIGSESPFSGNIKRYPFTFREIYRYSSKKHNYTEPNIQILPFPWLDERKRELDAVLNKCIENDDAFSLEDKEIVRRKLMCLFSRYDFDSNQLNKIKDIYDEDRIADIISFDVSDETIHQIYNWIQSLAFNDINPKAKWIKGKKISLVLGKNDTYKQNIKGLCGYNNHIIVDNLVVNRNDERYKYILRYHLFAIITTLYYANEHYALNILQKYIDGETDSYNSEYRKTLGTDININISHPIKEQLPDWIDNFFEDEFIINKSITIQYEKCLVTFEDETIDEVDGDVIADMGEDGYNDINIREVQVGMEISYYKAPDCFDDLIAACGEYADRWKHIIKYARLWKDKFIEAYNNILNQGHSKIQAIQILSDSCGIPEERTRAYYKNNNSKFLRSKREMKNILNYLTSQGLLTNDEKKNVILAKFYNSEIPLKFGTELKRELYNFFLCDSPESHLLDEISINSGLSKDDIFASAIVTNKKVKSIKIKTNNE